MRSLVVYKINCLDCKACYIGKTKRHLITRIEERKNTKKKVDSKFKDEHESAVYKPDLYKSPSLKSQKKSFASQSQTCWKNLKSDFYLFRKIEKVKVTCR